MSEPKPRGLREILDRYDSCRLCDDDPLEHDLLALIRAERRAERERCANAKLCQLLEHFHNSGTDALRCGILTLPDADEAAHDAARCVADEAAP